MSSYTMIQPENAERQTAVLKGTRHSMHIYVDSIINLISNDVLTSPEQMAPVFGLFSSMAVVNISKHDMFRGCYEIHAVCEQGAFIVVATILQHPEMTSSVAGDRSGAFMSVVDPEVPEAEYVDRLDDKFLTLTLESVADQNMAPVPMDTFLGEIKNLQAWSVDESHPGYATVMLVGGGGKAFHATGRLVPEF
jgi:hypothetical protein